MSRTPFFYVEKFNENTKKYELEHPIIWNYNHTKQERADLLPYNGCHDLFSIVQNRGDFPEMKGIHHGLPSGVNEEIIKAFKSCQFTNELTGDLYSPNVRWFTYADMYIYCLKYPTTIDYEAMDGVCSDDENFITPMTDNPIFLLKKRVDAFLEVMNYYEWDDDYSLIRIVYWIE